MLHEAVKSNASEALVMALLDTRRPNEAKELDEVRGHWAPTPLILAAARFSSRRLLLPVSVPHTRLIVRTLIMCVLHGCLAQSGWLPLHYAAASKASGAVVRLLLDAHFEGAKKQAGVHKVGNLPLHYAVMNQAPAMAVRALLKAHPEGAKEKGDVCGPFSNPPHPRAARHTY